MQNTLNEAVSLARQKSATVFGDKETFQPTGEPQINATRSSEIQSHRSHAQIGPDSQNTLAYTDTNIVQNEMQMQRRPRESLNPFDEYLNEGACIHSERESSKIFPSANNHTQWHLYPAATAHTEPLKLKYNREPFSSTQARLTCDTEVTDTHERPQIARNVQSYSEEQYRPTVQYEPVQMERGRWSPTHNLYRAYLLNQNSGPYTHNIELDRTVETNNIDVQNRTRYHNNDQYENQFAGYNVNNAAYPYANNNNVVNPFGRDQYRTKPVPIYQWNVYFSGDNPGKKRIRSVRFSFTSANV